MGEPPTIRRTLRPGDLGEVTSLHGRLYSEEYGLSTVFEADLAISLGRAVDAGWPERNGGVWLADHEGRVGACMALTFESEEESRLRWVLVAPALRGHGLARAMLAEAVAMSDEADRTLISFDTFSELTAAGRMYRESGFEVVSEQEWDRWGRPLTLQRYERRAARA